MMILPLVTSLIALHLIQAKHYLIETEEKKPERHVDYQRQIKVRYIKEYCGSGRFLHLFTKQIIYRSLGFQMEFP